MRREIKSLRSPRCRGTVLPWVLVSTIAMVGFTALAIDLGYLLNAQAELKTVANAAALAGGGFLLVGPDEARTQAKAYAAMNFANGQPVTLEDSDIEIGSWDEDMRTFTVIDETDPSVVPDAIRVTANLTTARGNPVTHLFGKVLGSSSSDVRARSTAFFQSRDIMLVLDLSSSMNDDSELRHVGPPPLLPQSDVEANLLQIWTEMGSPTFGNMQFQPTLISSDDNAEIMTLLGLDPVATPYPFPSGSWNDYIQYVKTDSHVDNVGYKKHYGYLTLVNYWLARQPSFHQTPVLWQTSEQPITAVKEAVSLFITFLTQVNTFDFLGLCSYTSASGQATLESSLTGNLQLIEDITWERQAGHYTTSTNIGAGIKTAREELIDNGRSPTFPKLIVLLTDGKANRPTDRAMGAQFARVQARFAGDEGFPILAISLGADFDDEDKALMDDVARLSGGIHFNVPAGGSIAELSEDLNSIFLQIASHRRLRLVE